MRRLPTWLTHWYTYRGAVGIISGVVLALLMFFLYSVDFPGVHPEDRFFAEDSAPASDVVIVGIDDPSIAALGHFPFTRDAYAKTLTQLQQAGAAAVVFDVGFSESYTPGGDQAFHDALLAAARAKLPVILAYGSADVVTGSHRLIQASIDPSTGRVKPTQDELPIRLFRCADVNADAYAPCATTISEPAATDILPDSDGIVRRMPMFVEPACHQQGKSCDALINSIGFAGYRHYFLQDQANQVQPELTPAGVTFGQAWSKPLWVDDNGQALIHYYGLPGDFPRHGQYVSMADVAAGTFSKDKVNGKVVLVGAYNATGLHDEQLVPTHNGDTFMQGVEIHANFVSTLQNQLRGGFLAPEPPGVVLLVMLVLGVLMGWVVARLSVVWGAVASAGVLVAYTVFWSVGQEALSTIPNVFHTWLVLAGTYTGVTAYRFLYEDREKRKVTAIFGQYLKPELVQQLASVRTLEELQLGGERRELSLLFCDIRGFTSMSETMAAEDVVKVATEYLDALTSIIFKWDGTIDKYVGDEIVAVWNAPHDQKDHALLAVRCAYDMISFAPQLQAKLLAMNLPPIRYGIGVNSGPVVWGNLGSRARRQFTALGDTMNTAARFCSAAGPFELLIGEPTYEACKDYLAVELAPGIQLKGKSADTFKIYRVIAIRETPQSPWVPFPTTMAAQVTTTNTAQFQTQQMAAGATVTADAVHVDATAERPPAG